MKCVNFSLKIIFYSSNDYEFCIFCLECPRRELNWRFVSDLGSLSSPSPKRYICSILHLKKVYITNITAVDLSVSRRREKRFFLVRTERKKNLTISCTGRYRYVERFVIFQADAKLKIQKPKKKGIEAK